MAKFRQVHIDFWQDGFVLDLTPEEKYFYLYLMTNSKTSQCGIYELPMRIIETETGYNRETVEKLLARFEEYEKVSYNKKTKEIMIINWVKFNWINSPKVITLIDKELKSVKDESFVKLFIDKCKEYGYRIDTLSILDKYYKESKSKESSNDNDSIPYSYPIDTVSIDSGEERERELEREEERELEQQQEENACSSRDEDFAEIVKFYSENLQRGVTESAFNMELLIKFYEEFGRELLDAAMKLAAKKEAKGISYVEAVLKNWREAKVKTLDDARRYEQQFKSYRKQDSKKDIVPDWYEKHKVERDQAIKTTVKDQQKTAEEADKMLQEYLASNA
jgi:DnaD/phage-associated family protein